MRIGIAGGCGFAGSNIAERFAEEGHEVVVVDNLTRKGSRENSRRLNEKNNITLQHGDTRRAGDLSALFDCDAIIDCAAQTSVEDSLRNPELTVSTNLTGFFNILQIAKETGAPLVYFASNKVYPSHELNLLPVIETPTRFEWDVDKIEERKFPGLTLCRNAGKKTIIKGINEKWPMGLGARSVYGATKACADLLCQEYKDAYRIPVFVNRFSCLAGPWQFGFAEQGWYVWFIIAANLGIPITFFGWEGKQVRDVLYIKDVYALIEKQVSSGLAEKSAGGVYNIGGGVHNTISLREHVEMLKAAGMNVVIENDSAPGRHCDQVIYISDSSKAESEFGWTPKTNIETSFKKCLEWVEKNSTDLEKVYKSS